MHQWVVYGTCQQVCPSASKQKDALHYGEAVWFNVLLHKEGVMSEVK